jgi:chromosome segregation ATPase
MLNLFQVLALHSLKPMPVYVVDLTDTPVDGTIVSNFIRKFMGNAQFVVISRR